MMGIVSSLYCPSLRPNDGQCYLVTDVIVYLTFYKKYPVKLRIIFGGIKKGRIFATFKQKQ